MNSNVIPRFPINLFLQNEFSNLELAKWVTASLNNSIEF